MNTINDIIKTAATVEAESRVIAMMQDTNFAEGKPDRFHVVAKMIVKMHRAECFTRFGSTDDIEQAIIKRERAIFASIK